MQTSSRYLNKVVAIIKYVIISLAILFVVVVAGVNLPFVQRIITSKANSIFLRKKIPLHIESLTLLIDGRIGVTKPEIVINSTDTIVYAEQVKVSVKILPLILRKINVETFTIENAVVNLAIDNVTGKLNLISVFSDETKAKEKKKGSGKKMQIGFNNVHLRNIRFTFTDKRSGTRIYQNVEKLNLGIEKFSLSEKEIIAEYADIEKVNGGVDLISSAPKQDTLSKVPADWKFKLSRGTLKEIKFTLLQPENNRRMDFSLGKSNISEAGFELAGKKITVANLSLEDPGVEVFSSPSETGNKGVVSKGGINPQPPQGGLYKSLSSNKSPLGDLGVDLNKEAFETASSSFPGPWIIYGDNVKITNGFYHTASFEDSSATVNKRSILQIAEISAALNDLKLSSPESGFTMNRLSIALENGFRLNKGDISFHSDSTHHSTLQSGLMTESSRINLKIDATDELAAIIKSWKNVPFSLNIENTEVSSDDISAFLPSFNEKPVHRNSKRLKLGINCNLKGTFDSLEIGNLYLKTPAGNNISLKGQLVNIINPKSAMINVDFQAGPLTSDRLNEILKMTGVNYTAPDFEPTSISGKASGSLTELEFFLNMEGLSGNIAATGSLDIKNKTYTLKMNSRDLEIGKIAGIKDLDRLSANIAISGKEFTPDKLNVKCSVTIDSAGYKGYIYHGIKAELSGIEGRFNFTLNSDDPSLGFDLSGSAELNRKLAKGTVSGMFEMDAGKLNLFNGISAKGNVEAELDKTAGDIESHVNISNLVAGNKFKTEDLKNLSISFQSNDTVIKGDLKSDFVQAAFRFGGSIEDLGKIFSKNNFRGLYILDSTVNNRIPFVSAFPVVNLSVESTYDPFLGLLISDSIFSYKHIEAKMSKDSAGIARADMFIDRFNLGTSSAFGSYMHFINLPDSSSIILKSDSIRYRNISLTALEADLTADNDTLGYRFKASTKNDSLLFDIAGAAFKDDREINIISTQPEWVVNGFHWIVNPGIFLVLEPLRKDFIADMHWKNDQHKIDIYGRKSDKLFLGLEKIWLNMLAIPGMNLFGYDAELTGLIDYQGNTRNAIGVRMDLRQMKISGNQLGNMSVDGSFISDSLGNIESDIKSILNDTSRLDLAIRSVRKTGQKSLRTEFKAIPLNMLESFVSKYVSGLKGEVSGNIVMATTAENPRFDGEIKIKNTELKVVPLNARFYLKNDVILLENSKMHFNQFNVLDSLDKQLFLSGTMDLENPGNVTADLKITSDHLQVMNTTARENPAFNGSIFVDSRLTVTGPVQKPAIAGNIVLAEGTVVKYKLSENLNVSETEKTVTFARLNEDNGLRKSKVNLISRSPNIEASIEINPNSLFNFEISRGYDIGISITGGGFLNYTVLPNGSINLSGTYQINQGRSELKIPGWPRKDFVITAGSFVKWNGAVDDPELNIETTSKVRGSYYNPVDGQNREVNFIVNMKIFNRLSQLEILFDVSSNDQYITSVFSTLSKDERMKQAINLLIFGRVELPNMASSSDYVTQQINQFWESQINQLTKSAIKGVDLSFGIDTYTGAKEGGGEQTYTSFTCEVKKEVFNERGSVLVSGRMNDNSKAGAPTNNMLENFIFEYAIDTSRTKYLKVYRQQNYEDLLEGEVIKSGVGFIYRKSYNRLSDIWRRERKKVRENVNNVN